MLTPQESDASLFNPAIPIRQICSNGCSARAPKPNEINPFVQIANVLRANCLHHRLNNIYYVLLSLWSPLSDYSHNATDRYIVIYYKL